MEIVINISDKDYQLMKDGHIPFNVLDKMMNGIPLPKGHGKLFDEKDIVNGSYQIIGNRIYELEPIIEADTESEEV